MCNREHAKLSIITIIYLYALIVVIIIVILQLRKNVLKYCKKVSKRCAYKFRKARKKLYTRTLHKQKIESFYCI